MGKIITCTDGTVFERVSRGISLKTDYNVTPRHELYDHRDEDNNSVYYIEHAGMRIPSDSMIALGSMWDPEPPHVFVEKGETRRIIACDWYNTLYYIEYREENEKYYLYLKH